MMSAKVHLCDGDCGNIYYEIDLNEACGQMMCKDFMCIFLQDEANKEHSE